MAGEICLFSKCHGASNWNFYGSVTKENVVYSELLGRKEGFQKFINFTDIQISKSGKMDSYCIVDKMFTPSKGSNIDIFFFDEEHQGSLYLEYSVHKQHIIKNYNDLITFLNFHKNSIFHLHSSFIYVKSTPRFKWTLYFSVLEFLIKKLNTSIIGSQFYIPLFSKYLIMNELRLLLVLQNCLLNVSENFKKTVIQACAVSKLRVKTILPSRTSHSIITLQSKKKTVPFSYEQPGQKIERLTVETSKLIKNIQQKRKSINLDPGGDFLPKTKRFNSTKKEWLCRNYIWKIFTSFKNHTLSNYSSILEAKKWVDKPEAMNVSPIDCEFQTDLMQYSNSCSLHQTQSKLNQDISIAINKSDETLSEQVLDKPSNLKNITVFDLEEKQSKYSHTSDFRTLKEMKYDSSIKEYSNQDDTDNFRLATECKDKKKIPIAMFADETQKNIAGPSKQMPQKAGIFEINKASVSFQTASGKSLQISELALQAAKKMFEEISSENLNSFPQKKTGNSTQPKSIVVDKQCVGFQTASGKSLHASKAALNAAEIMFKEINVEETDIFLEKLSQTKQNSKECYPSVKECYDEDISKVLAENFFEDIPFDEKEIDSKPINDSEVFSIEKPEIAKTTVIKKRKSLGGRRSLKPYTLKK